MNLIFVLIFVMMIVKLVVLMLYVLVARIINYWIMVNAFNVILIVQNALGVLIIVPKQKMVKKKMFICKIFVFSSFFFLSLFLFLYFYTNRYHQRIKINFFTISNCVFLCFCFYDLGVF